MKNKELEKNRPTFLLIGLSAALGISFLAFEWRSYEKMEHDRWIYIDELIDTITPPKAIPLPKPKAASVPKLKPNSEILEIVKLEMDELKLEDAKKKDNQNEVENPEDLDLWEDENENEPLESLGFKPFLKNPDTRPFFQTKSCLKIDSNFDRYRYSIQKIQRQIQNRLYRPELLFSQIEFEIQFRIDTTGQVTTVNVIGTDNKDIINSAEQTMYRLPKMQPAYHEGEKRVMETGIRVKIIY